MSALNTLDEARANGATHVCCICEKCRRSNSLKIDVIKRRTRFRTLDEVAGAFKCKRCGSRPDRVMFTEPDSKIHYFNYVVLVWNENRIDVDHVEAAAMNLEDIRPAFRSISKRFPKRWVSLESRDGLVGDSDRFEALDEVDL